MTTRVLYPVGSTLPEKFTVPGGGQTVFSLVRGAANDGFAQVLWNGLANLDGSHYWDTLGNSGSNAVVPSTGPYTYQLRSPIIWTNQVWADTGDPDVGWIPLTEINTGVPSETEVLIDWATGLMTFNAAFAGMQFWAGYVTSFEYVFSAGGATLAMTSVPAVADVIEVLYYKDVKRVQAAIEGGTVGLETWTKLPDGDTLLLKARKQADEPSGAITPWMFLKQLTDEPWAFQSYGGVITEARYGMPVNIGMPVVITGQRITISGEASNGVPITVIQGAKDQAAFLDKLQTTYLSNFWQGFGSCSFFATGKAYVDFKDLSFKYMNSYLAGITCWGAALNFDNLHVDFADVGLDIWKDNRFTAPVSVKDCEFRNIANYALYLVGNVAGGVVENCKFYGNPVDLGLTDLLGYGTYWWALSARTLGGYVASWLEGDDSDYTKQADLEIRECLFDFTGSTMHPYDACWVRASSGETKNVSVVDCQFIGHIGTTALNFGIDDHGGGPGVLQSCSASGNTFTGCSAGYGILHAYGYNDGVTVEKASDVLFTDNTFVDSVQGVGPQVDLWNCTSSQIVKNEYKDSGVPTKAVDAYLSAIVLESCDHGTVYEKKQSFPTSRSVEDYVTDVNGYENTVITVKMNGMIAPIKDKNKIVLKHAEERQQYIELEARFGKRANHDRLPDRKTMYMNNHKA